MSKESEGLYSFGAIRARYQYYTGGRFPATIKQSFKRRRLTDIEKREHFSKDFENASDFKYVGYFLAFSRTF